MQAIYTSSVPKASVRPSFRNVRARASADTSASGTPSFEIPPEVKKAVEPVVNFLDASDVDITTNSIYQEKVVPILSSPFIATSVGWTPTAELINGRAAMLGWFTCFTAELISQKDFLQQFAVNPLSVLVTLGLITAATIIPIVKGTKGEYLDALKEASINLPAGIFTEKNERINGRLAMVGIFFQLFIEIFYNKAIF